MATSTRFTDLVGCELPLQLAALGGVGTPELASAVAAAGGFGMVPNGQEPGDGAMGVNFLLPFGPSVEDVAEAAAKFTVVEFFYGDPEPQLIEVVHRGGALAGWQTGSVAEARAAEECGSDYVVAQGTEAGGHVRGKEALDDLLPELIAAVRVPVLAAGGVATAERFRELIGAGADGVRVGTRFVASPESGAHPDYVRQLLDADAEDTELTEWFSENWEAAPHRVLRTALDAAKQSGWRAPVPPYKGVDGDPATMAMYAGTGVGEVNAAEPAATVVADLVRLL
jgi:NAD(P)H-dependent flavin oxidoreductase YrpB (nitropropane dioxygenase family)